MPGRPRYCRGPRPGPVGGPRPGPKPCRDVRLSIRLSIRFCMGGPLHPAIRRVSNRPVSKFELVQFRGFPLSGEIMATRRKHLRAARPLFLAWRYSADVAFPPVRERRGGVSAGMIERHAVVTADAKSWLRRLRLDWRLGAHSVGARPRSLRQSNCIAGRRLRRTTRRVLPQKTRRRAHGVRFGSTGIRRSTPAPNYYRTLCKLAHATGFGVNLALRT